MKKQILLTTLTLTLLASAVIPAAAEEVVATILFEPERIYNSNGFSYAVDTTGNGVVDRQMQVVRSSRTDPIFDTLTNYYLKPGVKFIFEDKDLKPFQEFGDKCLIAIEVNGRMVELSEMFPLNEIKDKLSYLYAKLVREGRDR